MCLRYLRCLFSLGKVKVLLDDAYVKLMLLISLCGGTTGSVCTDNDLISPQSCWVILSVWRSLAGRAV